MSGSGGSPQPDPTERPSRPAAPEHAARAVWAALAANLVIMLAKAAVGVLSGSPAMYAEAAHSAADSLNELFLLASLRRSRRAADAEHPFGYGMERFFWSLLAAVGIFVTGGIFSFYQGIRSWLRPEPESPHGYALALGVLAVALVAEGSSLVKALVERRRQQAADTGRPASGTAAGGGATGGGGADGSTADSGTADDGTTDGARDPALRTIVAEDATAVAGVLTAALGIGLHAATGVARWESAASLAIGVLLIYVAFRLAAAAQSELIGEAVGPAFRQELREVLAAQEEIDAVLDLLSMRLGPDSTLLAARVDLRAGFDSEEIELACLRIKDVLRGRWPELDHIFLDITDAPTERRAASARSRPGAGQSAP